MRRYTPTLILLIILLVFGGLAIYGSFNSAVLTGGYYVPTLNSEAETAQTQALILVGGVVALLCLTVGMGGALAFAFYLVTKVRAGQAGSESPAQSEAGAKPGAGKAAGEAPQPFLSDTRSLAMFWAVVIVVTVGFLVLRFSEQPLGYLPNPLVTLAAPTPMPTQPSSGASADAATLQAELDALPKGDLAGGQAVFSSAGCVACHSLVPDVKIVGPSLAGVGPRAASRKPGYSAELYIYESITRPNAYVVDGFAPDIMPKTFKDTLSPQDLANVIAFLLSQH